MHAHRSTLLSLGLLLVALGSSACGEDTSAWRVTPTGHVVHEATLLEGQRPRNDLPLRSPLRAEDLVAVGAVAGHRGLCTGTVVAPTWVLTTKSCILAVTTEHAPAAERLAELKFIAAQEVSHNHEPIAVKAARTDSLRGLQGLMHDATHTGLIWRPQDELVALELSEPVFSIAPLPVTHNTSIALYAQPRLITVRHSAEGAGERQPVGPRSQRAEMVYENADHALFGNDEHIAKADFGAPLLACDAGRWVVLGALSSSEYRDDDGSRTSQLKIGPTAARARYLRVDITHALWQFQRRNGQVFELQATEPTAGDEDDAADTIDPVPPKPAHVPATLETE